MSYLLKIALLAASVIVLSGCAKHARFETTGGGHAIFLQVKGGHTIESRPTHATVAGEFGCLTIECDRARIDGGQWTGIPEGVPVEAKISKREVSIHAGRVTISRTVR